MERGSSAHGSTACHRPARDVPQHMVTPSLVGLGATLDTHAGHYMRSRLRSLPGGTIQVVRHLVPHRRHQDSLICWRRIRGSLSDAPPLDTIVSFQQCPLKKITIVITAKKRSKALKKRKNKSPEREDLTETARNIVFFTKCQENREKLRPKKNQILSPRQEEEEKRKKIKNKKKFSRRLVAATPQMCTIGILGLWGRRVEDARLRPARLRPIWWQKRKRNKKRGNIFHNLKQKL